MDRVRLDRIASERGGFVQTVSRGSSGSVALFVGLDRGEPTMGCTGADTDVACARLLHSLTSDSVLTLADPTTPEYSDDLIEYLAPQLEKRGFSVKKPEHTWQVLEALRSALGEKHFRNGLIALGLTPGAFDRTLAVLDSRTW